MSYKIGTSHGDLDFIYNQFPAFRSVQMSDPYNDPMEYSRNVELLDGTVRGLGWLTQSWHWAFMSEAQCEALRGFIGNVNIVTPNNAGDFTEYTAIMVWPDKEPEHRAGRVLDITVTFKNLLAVT